MMFSRMLIANRGEIACRVIATAKRLGIVCVAVYSDADLKAHYVELADEAYRIGPAPATASYLNIDNIISVAKLSRCDAIHPGYGFLAESPAFAKACAKEKIVFIGPSASAITVMGSKSAAKRRLEQTGVPLLPSYHGEQQDNDALVTAAEKLGYPLLVKPAWGGGGKGMFQAHDRIQLIEAIEPARRLAQSAFGNELLLLERLLIKPRHIEVQIAADQHGNIVSLGDRDCTIQRHYQKVVEEAPAPDIPEELREQLSQAAIDVAKAIHYTNVGTVEFLLSDDGEFYFLEMNTRLQVEHPVTEMISGQDLVEWQCRIAAGEPLPCSQSEIQLKGHAIEVRLCAEDPVEEFHPSSGRLEQTEWPEGQHVRVDTGYQSGDMVPSHYDSLLAKVVACSNSRAEALRCLDKALAETRVFGIPTNIAFVRRVINNPDFIQAQLSTDFIQTHQQSLLSSASENWPGAWFAALMLARSGGEFDSGWRLNAPAVVTAKLEDGFGFNYDIRLVAKDDGFEAQDHQIRLVENKGDYRLVIDGQCLPFRAHRQLDSVWIQLDSGPRQYRVASSEVIENASSHQDQLKAPMNGTVVANLVDKGTQVTVNQPLVIMEAMKMEYQIRAPIDAEVVSLPFQPGDQVEHGQALIALRPY